VPNSIKNTIQKPEVSFWMAIILPLLGFAVMWGVQTTKVNSIDEKMNYRNNKYEEQEKEYEARFKETDVIFMQIQVSLAEIQKDIAYIKLALD